MSPFIKSLVIFAGVATCDIIKIRTVDLYLYHFHNLEKSCSEYCRSSRRFLAEFGDFSKFENPARLLWFAVWNPDIFNPVLPNLTENDKTRFFLFAIYSYELHLYSSELRACICRILRKKMC